MLNANAGISDAQLKPRTTTLRLLEPMSRIEAMVFTRSAAGEFSCRMYGRGKCLERVTILGVVMPDRLDIAGEPTLRTIDPNTYYDLIEATELRSSLYETALRINAAAEFCGIEVLRMLVSQLEGITL